ncbi:MAG: hypothetical protein ACTHJT_12675 [Cytophaga sp.]|uniref:hypothetical protein n=1 Tax=Cytophaga sp. TaxID=29535 RepID=UPI003F807F25
MKTLLIRLLLVSVIFFYTDFSHSTTKATHTCYYKNHPLTLGPKGGCYYINSSGNKTYVDRSYCNCE